MKMKIAAFNAKQLGWAKVHKNVVRKTLIKIVSRYSVVVLLEVVDQTGKAMEKLLDELNRNQRQHQYDMICSESLGRSSYKEKFVFFYRVREVSIINTYQYRESREDVLAREPFIVRFRRLNAGAPPAVKELALIPVHTKPEDAERELDALVKVVNAVRRRWSTENIMILGDFNADGRYLSKKKKEKIRICSAPYHWLIDDDVDTTSSNCNDHTYDRIVVYGQTMLNAIVPGSAKSFNFQREFKLTDEETLGISDHYPVEVELKTNQKHKAPRQRRTPLTRTARTASTRRQTQKKGPQKKKKDVPAGLEGKKKKTTTKRNRGQSSDTPAKRRRLDNR